jgi:peroxiredoxin
MTFINEYLNKLSKKRDTAAQLKEEMKKDSTLTTKNKEKLLQLDIEVDEFQRNLMKKEPNALTSLIIKASRDVEVPKFEGSGDDIRNKRYFWYKTHFFDNFNVDDERLIRTPLLYNRVDYYMNKLVVQHPDTLIQETDYILRLNKNVPDAFKFFCTHLLNYYAKSDIIGHDAIYVHLALNYYDKPGVTPWVDKDAISKIVDNAKSLAPTLLGVKAADFELQTRDNKTIRLYDIKAEYTVLVFWAPDCGHCQKEMPDIVKFWEKWRTKGVELISICNRFTPDKLPECWKFLDEHPEMKFTTGVDLYIRSNTQNNYYVKSTPMIFILDKDKKIMMKKIKGEKLDEILNELILIEEEKAKYKK